MTATLLFTNEQVQNIARQYIDLYGLMEWAGATYVNGRLTVTDAMGAKIIALDPHKTAVPNVISMTQARQWLISNGTIDAVNAALSKSDMPTQLLNVAWEYDLTIARKSKLADFIGNVLATHGGVSLDVMFVAAVLL